PHFTASPLVFTVAAPTALYTLSLHDALPIFQQEVLASAVDPGRQEPRVARRQDALSVSRPVANHVREVVEYGERHSLVRQELRPDRKSTRLNSSHVKISYAVFCLKKKVENIR